MVRSAEGSTRMRRSLRSELDAEEKQFLPGGDDDYSDEGDEESEGEYFKETDELLEKGRLDDVKKAMTLIAKTIEGGGDGGAAIEPAELLHDFDIDTDDVNNILDQDIKPELSPPKPTEVTDGEEQEPDDAKDINAIV